MYSPSVRYDILRAREAGLDAETIERLTGVPPRTQQRIAHEEIPYGMDHQMLHHEHHLGRRSVLSETLRHIIDGLLGEEPRMKGAELLRRLRTDHGYQDGKNPVYLYLKTARPIPPAPLPIVRFEGLPGEFAQYDFGKLPVPYLDHPKETVVFFAGRLKFSRLLSVSIVADETTETILRAIEACAREWGGLPLFNVVDNTKSAVLGRSKDPHTGAVRIELNRHFHDFLQQVGVFAEPTAPYSGQQKGSVENLVGFVKEGFVLARQFRHPGDLLGQLPEWLHQVNFERPCDATKEIPAVRFERERERLHPVPFGSFGYGMRFPKVVSRSARVSHNGLGYSTPDRWIGKSVLLRLHAETVVLLWGAETVVHPRVPENGRYSLLPEHQAALFVKPRGEVMAKRQILIDLSREAHDFFTELVHRRPLTWRTNDLPIAWELYERYGARRLQDAFAVCLAAGTIGGEYLRHFLSPFDRTALPPSSLSEVYSPREPTPSAAGAPSGGRR